MDSDQPVLIVRPEGLNPEIKALAASAGIEIVASDVVPLGKAFLHYPYRNQRTVRRITERRNLIMRLTRGDVS